MTAKQAEFTTTDTGKQHRFAVPLKEVVMLLHGGRPHCSHLLEAARRALMYESLGITSNDEGSSGYEQEGPEDNSNNNNSNNTDVNTNTNVNEIRQSSSIPHLESIVCSSEESEDGYEGDNDYDALDTRSIGTTDSLVLTAERLPHLIHHPQRFCSTSTSTSSSRNNNDVVRVPRRMGKRASCVLRRKAALRRSVLAEVANTEEDSSEAKDHVPTALGLSFRLLRSQDSLLLTRERLEEQHQQQQKQEQLDSTSETDDDDSLFAQSQTIQTTSTSSSVGSGAAAAASSAAKVVDTTAIRSPRGIACTYDHFLPQTMNGSSAQHKKALSDGSIAFPSLSPVDHKEASVTFE